MEDSPGEIPEITLEEVQACVKRIKSNKSPGPDTIPAEQLKASEVAMSELHHLLSAIWTQEVIPNDFALGDMLMHYKVL